MAQGKQSGIMAACSQNEIIHTAKPMIILGVHRSSAADYSTLIRAICALMLNSSDPALMDKA
eukprot:scaffold72347_cov37-Prasinocladus_malaysianus.AAC.1